MKTPDFASCGCGSTSIKVVQHTNLSWSQCEDCGATGPADQRYTQAVIRWNLKRMIEKAVEEIA